MPGVGKTKNRENLAAYGTDKEGGLRSPEDPFFKRFAAECSRVQVGRALVLHMIYSTVMRLLCTA